MSMGAEIVLTRVIGAHESAEMLVPPMRRLGGAIARRMRRTVPKRSWRLHDTIDTATTIEGNTVVTRDTFGGRTVRGKLVNYGMHVEKGTSRQAPQPFARPALLQSTDADLVT